MFLNLPIYDRLERCEKVLLAGMGGGFDLFCGLPIYFELKRKGVEVELANFSFSDIESWDGGVKLSPTLAGVTGEQERTVVYFPEYHLAKWFKSHLNKNITVWCFHKTGAASLLDNYHILQKHLNFDGIVLIDGGFDALIRGDEAETGSLIEDALSLCVVNEMDSMKERLICCTGFGIELGLSFDQILENISGLIREDGFYGSCSLLKNLNAYEYYESAVLYVQSQLYQDPSVINSSIISATRGDFGDVHLTPKTRGSHLNINPLMSQYWFFDLKKVAMRNLYISQLLQTRTFMEALEIFLGLRPLIPRRKSNHFKLI